MKISQIAKPTIIESLVSGKPLYEGLDLDNLHTVTLWESAGYKLLEAELTPDQIEQIFQGVEQGATAAGGNRTMLGKGKDAAEAVNKAWEDLKTKVQNSGPIKNVDGAYDSAVAKIEAGLGGPDNAVNKVIQKYRKFAKEHPIAQGLIYSALIAAAGISGAGLGGAAVLGLLKMTDKLLQGEKFSSAAYSGAKTGAMAYGASKVADYFKGAKAGEVPAGPAGAPTPPSNADTFADLANDPNLNSIQQKFAADLAAGKRIQGADEYIQKAIDAAAKRAQMFGPTADGTANAGEASFASLQRLQNAMLDAQASTGNSVSNAVSSIDASGATDAVSNTSTASGITARPSGLQPLNNLDGSVRPGAGAANAAISGGDVAGTAADTASNVDTSTATDAAANAAGSGQITASFTDGMKGTLTDVDGSSVPMTAYPPDGIQPRMPMGSEKVEFNYNGKKVTAYIYGGKAYVPKFDPTATESAIVAGTKLSESQIRSIFYKATANQMLMEGPWDTIKGAAGKAANWAQTKGHNLTTKVTADKLKQAWTKAGSPTDSQAVSDILQQNGVSADVVNKVYTDMKIDNTPAQQNADPEGKVEPTMDPEQPDTQAQPADAPATDAEDKADDKKEPTMDPQQTNTQPADAPAADAQPADASEQPVNSGTVFDDYKNLQQLWSQYLDADGSYPPQFRGVLRDILLTAMKTVEGKQIFNNAEKILYEAMLNEFGNRPNDSTDPRTAGGAPNAVGNLKDRRAQRAATLAKNQTPAPAPQQTPAPAPAPAPSPAPAPAGNETPAPQQGAAGGAGSGDIWDKIVQSFYRSGRITTNPRDNVAQKIGNWATKSGGYTVGYDSKPGTGANLDGTKGDTYGDGGAPAEPKQLGHQFNAPASKPAPQQAPAASKPATPTTPATEPAAGKPQPAPAPQQAPAAEPAPSPAPAAEPATEPAQAPAPRQRFADKMAAQRPGVRGIRR